MRVVGVLSCRKEGRSIDQEEESKIYGRARRERVVFRTRCVCVCFRTQLFETCALCWRWKYVVVDKVDEGRDGQRWLYEKRKHCSLLSVSQNTSDTHTRQNKAKKRIQESTEARS